MFRYLVAFASSAGSPNVGAISKRRRRVRSSTSSPHYWQNSSDIQVFCRNETQAPIFTEGDEDLGGPGIVIYNFDPHGHGDVNGAMYFVYESNHDFVPYKYLIIPPWSSVFLSVCPTFRGRIVRGSPFNLDGRKHLLGTWAEVNWHANETWSAWGDISILQGNDGAATIESLDGLFKFRGFMLDLLSYAPADAWAQKATGSWCLDKIIGEDANNVTMEWERQFIDPWNVYLRDDIDPVINSNNGRFQVTFYEGIF
ncbi:uncharacterized protein GGS22DRAFT_197604 [Annulohypoxylon maeteangense]|uniref:uncharacterized protein n=1 Tax=Annulohypoxylon maeteangense TaxID=1927788 RepID=UPI0020077B2C|nr:uncharacterized protein GGS22DRAFT_197604 [Annulohypoxylon maeteangense]KAI0880303.1 hypothetical protein GGS22DRAFT_197604 [Annulohypoxylon maeteangense]